MKLIALKLGLPETATESEIMAAIQAIQLTAAAVKGYQEAMEEAGASMDEFSKEVFVELSKVNPKKAMKFLQLNKATETETEEEGEEPEATVKLANAKPGKTTVQKKEVSVLSLVQKGKASNTGTPADEDKDCFDYLQKKNPTELARLHKEDNAKYLELAKAYQGGKRYTGK